MMEPRTQNRGIPRGKRELALRNDDRYSNKRENLTIEHHLDAGL